MSAETPRISCIIPVHNQAAYLAEAIESVLAQTRPAFEIVVVDNASTDGSAEVARRFGPRVVCLEAGPKNLGLARNAGLRASRGDFIAPLDADDLWVPDKLETQARILAERPGLDLVGAEMENFLSPDLDEAARARFVLPPGPVPGLAASVLLIRRSVFDRVGLYETSWTVGTDLEWLTRARAAGLTTHIVPRVLARRRLHARNSGLREAASARERARVLKQALDRRRAAEGNPGGEGKGRA